MSKITSVVIDTENVTDYVDFNSLNLQDRCDEAFAIGSFVAWLKGPEWKYNIRPYTRLYVNNELYVCSSSSTAYLTEEDLYIHRVNVLEATSLLSCFILGTKSFSTSGTHRMDYEKIDIIFTLMADKYKKYFHFDYSFNEKVLNKEIEYTFGSGTTMFDALSEIAGRYNRRVKVTSYDKVNIYITFDNIDSNVEYGNDQVLSATYSQNPEQFCKFLETEASNVVDRTTLTHVSNLTCRSDDVVLTADTAKLFLPSPIESIVDFGVERVNERIVYQFSGMMYDADGNELSSGSYTNAELVANNPKWGAFYTNVMYKYCTRSEWDAGKSQYTSSTTSETNPPADALAKPRVSSMGILQNPLKNSIPYKQSMIDHILPKEKWNLLTEKEQPKYFMYQTGSNVIENLHAEYKMDIWNALLGESQRGYLYDDWKGNYKTNGVRQMWYNGVPYSYMCGLGDSSYHDGQHSGNPLDNIFYCDYYAITNPILVDEKTETSPNGTFEFGKSYNNSANLIDFDKIGDYMSITNNSIGREELSIELDVTDTNIPKARQYIVYDDIKWYVSSVVTQYKYEKVVSTLNLVRNYNKVADSIGVDTQYRATKNPLNMIITRPINLGTIVDYTHKYDTSKEYYFRFVLRNYVYYKRAVVQASTKQVVFYCEADDQYSLATKVGASGKGANTYIQEYVPYGDSNNELIEATASIVTLPVLSKTNGDKLPIYGGIYTSVYSSVTKKVYKDAREKLTFTLKIILE